MPPNVRSPIEFEVVPEIGLKHPSIDFILGTPLNLVISLIQQSSRILHNVQLLYSVKDPLDRDLCIHLANDGIRLFFDSNTQLLKLIEIDDLSHIVLKYQGRVFSEPNDEASMEKVDEHFGSTHPGAFDERQKIYVRSWPGLSFCFPTVNSGNFEVAPGFSPNLRSLKYDVNSQPRLTKMSIFPHNHEEVQMPLACYCGQNATLLAEVRKDEVGRITGCVFHFLSQTGNPAVERSSMADLELIQLERTLSFGDTATDVMVALGAPSKVFYKNQEKMSIHRGAKEGNVEPNYFFNYFSMGVDVLFDAITNRVIKIILHSNIPGHYDFGFYSRCNFKATLGTENPIEIHTGTRYNEMSSLFVVDGAQTQPVIVSHNAGEERNPFGPTYCYGLPGVVIEVMENGHVAALTLFESSL